MKKITFKVNMQKDSSVISLSKTALLIKEINNISCHIRLDFENSIVVVENANDTMIDSVIDLVNSNYTILRVDIDNVFEESADKQDIPVLAEAIEESTAEDVTESGEDVEESKAESHEDIEESKAESHEDIKQSEAESHEDIEESNVEANPKSAEDVEECVADSDISDTVDKVVEKPVETVETQASTPKVGGIESALLEVLGTSLDKLDKSKSVKEQVESFMAEIGMPKSAKLVAQSFEIACDIKKINYDNVVLNLHSLNPNINQDIISASLRETFKIWLEQYPSLAEKYPKISLTALLKVFAKRFS